MRVLLIQMYQTLKNKMVPMYLSAQPQNATVPAEQNNCCRSGQPALDKLVKQMSYEMSSLSCSVAPWLEFDSYKV